MSTVVGPAALCWNGLITWYADWIFQTTRIKALEGKQVYNSLLWYLPEMDQDDKYIKRVVRTCFAPARLPTPERALVDNMRHQDIFEEFFFVEGLRNYVDEHPDLTTLREVARNYDVLHLLEEWLIEIQDRSDLE